MIASFAKGAPRRPGRDRDDKPWELYRATDALLRNGEELRRLVEQAWSDAQAGGG